MRFVFCTVHAEFNFIILFCLCLVMHCGAHRNIYSLTSSCLSINFQKKKKKEYERTTFTEEHNMGMWLESKKQATFHVNTILAFSCCITVSPTVTNTMMWLPLVVWLLPKAKNNHKNLNLKAQSQCYEKAEGKHPVVLISKFVLPQFLSLSLHIQANNHTTYAS